MCISIKRLAPLTAALVFALGCRQVVGIDGVVGTSWSEVTPDADSPPPRNSHAIAYDAARERLVLFGGRSDDADHLGDTWAWTGSAWSEVTPAEAGPPARRNHALAYDAAREEVILFGGVGEEGDELGDTWAWDGEAWEEVKPPSDSPSAREGHALAYDAARERVILFGGVAEPLNFLGDTWAWDGEAWEEITPRSVSPSAREGHDLAYDAARERVVLFGGTDDPLSLLNDTWEWDGSAWSEVTPAGEIPEVRALHALTFDPTRRRTVLFGGHPTQIGSRLDDTWEWDGAAWIESESELAPPDERSGHALVYDESARRVVLFGGFDGNDRLGDTWLEGPVLGD